MAKTKKIKALLGTNKMSDPDLLKNLNQVHDGMNGNSAFSNAPVDMPTFKAGIDSLTVLVTDAADGGKRAISARNKQRGVCVKTYTQLGHYVEGACNDDLAVFNTSGFTAAPTTRTTPGPLPAPNFEWIDRGAGAGQVEVKVKSLTGAKSYVLRYGIGAIGSTPSAWIEVPLAGTKKSTITNLTPGATYQFQVRALGQLGYSDWSDSMTFICG